MPTASQPFEWICCIANKWARFVMEMSNRESQTRRKGAIWLSFEWKHRFWSLDHEPGNQGKQTRVQNGHVICFHLFLGTSKASKANPNKKNSFLMRIVGKTGEFFRGRGQSERSDTANWSSSWSGNPIGESFHWHVFFLLRTCQSTRKSPKHAEPFRNNISIVPFSISYSTFVSLTSVTSILLGQSAPNDCARTKEPLLKFLVFLAYELNGYQWYEMMSVNLLIQHQICIIQ